MKKPKEGCAAIVTIKDASNMSSSGRRAIAKWLRNHADMLVKDGKNYSKRFVGRYMYLIKS